VTRDDIIRMAREVYGTEYTEQDLRFAALVAAAEREAVAWMSLGKERLEFARKDTVYGSHTIPLYTTPPRREWKGLTEEEQEALWDEAVDRQEHFCSQYGEFADAIEAKLKEKNA